MEPRQVFVCTAWYKSIFSTETFHTPALRPSVFQNRMFLVICCGLEQNTVVHISIQRMLRLRNMRTRWGWNNFSMTYKNRSESGSGTRDPTEQKLGMWNSLTRTPTWTPSLIRENTLITWSGKKTTMPYAYGLREGNIVINMNFRFGNLQNIYPSKYYSTRASPAEAGGQKFATRWPNLCVT